MTKRTDDELYGDVLTRVAHRARRPTPYQIAVPSYQRADTIARRTLATLERLHVDADRITVFAATAAEAEAYRDACDVSVVVARPGLFKCRRYYSDVHYPPGTRILNLDDDVDGLWVKADTKLVAYVGTLDHLAGIGFAMCEAVGAQLWGFAAAANAFYMADEAVAGLRYICGIAHGTIAGDPVNNPVGRSLSSGQDFERSLTSYRTYGNVVRIGWIAPKTVYFAPGGMQAELGGKDERAADHAARLAEIAHRHPRLARVVQKAGGVPNLRLASKTSVRVPRQSLEHAASSVSV